MVEALSFNKYEHRLVHNFREKINRAESTEDVRRLFVNNVKEILEIGLERKIRLRSEDIVLSPDYPPYYSLSEHLLASEDLMPLLNVSDLRHTIFRFAKPAAHRYKHLKKHQEKTKAKIRTEFRATSHKLDPIVRGR
jgi:hypothetical protein